MMFRPGRYIRQRSSPACVALLLGFFSFFMHGCGNASGPQPPPSDDVEKRISIYKDRIKADPEHYPSYTLLGVAYLDKAQDTHDPSDIESARNYALRSIEIQNNFEALKLLARIEGFVHRFDSSISYAEQAAKAAPESKADSQVASILVDAYLALGKQARAKELLDESADESFHHFASLGTYSKAIGDKEGAVAAYENASSLALKQNAGAQQSWALTMAAGVWLDSGNADKALPFLERAEKIAPESKVLLIHKAEYLAAKGRIGDAEDIYVGILGRWDDPEIHRRMFNLLKSQAKEDEAKEHFELAQKGFRRILDAGQPYPLGPLAQMLCDAGTRLDEAKRLSKENLKYKRDAEALATDRCVNALPSGK